MPSLLMKGDRRAFDEVARRIIPRKDSGCLIFLGCNAPELTGEIVDGLRASLGAYRLELQNYGQGHALLRDLPAFDSAEPVVHLFRDYPHERFENPIKAKTWDRSLCQNLNLERDLIPKRSLKLILLLPERVVDMLPLVAADFYLFRTWSYFFRDDLVATARHRLRRDLAADEETRRIIRLEKNLSQTSDFRIKANLHMDLAKANMSADDHALAIKHFEQAQKLYKRKKLAEGMAEALFQIGLAYFSQSLHRKAEPFVRQALQAFKRANSEHVKDALMMLGHVCYHTCRYREALDYYEQALGTRPEERGKMVYWSRLGICRVRDHLGDSRAAEEDYHRLLAELEQLELSKEGQAAFYCDLAGLYLSLGEPQTGALYMKQASELQWNPDIATRWVSYHLLAGEWEMAETVLLQALEEKLAPVDRASFQYDMAAMRLKQGRTAEAEPHIRQATASLAELEHEPHSREALVLELDILCQLGKYGEAEPRYRHYLHEWDEGPMFYIADLHRGLGFLLAETERADEAETHAQQALAIARRSRYRLQEGETLILIARLQCQRGEYQAALESLKTAYELVRDRDIPLEAHILELLGDTALASGLSKARAWYRRSLKRFRHLELPHADALADRIRSLYPDLVDDQAELPANGELDFPGNEGIETPKKS